MRKMKLPPASMKKEKTKKRSNWKPDSERGTRQKRGYDLQWLRLRKEFLLRNPLCEICRRDGRRRLASQVDHIVPFVGLNDPLRLSINNLQALCLPCHRRKTSSTSRANR